MTRTLTTLTCVALLTGCAAHKHMDRGAPGHTNLDVPPQMPPGFAEPQGDPGEHIVAVTAGATPSGGLGVVDGNLCGFAVIGGEVTLNKGTNARSHNEDDFVVLPLTGRGINVGGGVIILSDEQLRGPVYAEVQWFEELAGVAAGWSLDTATLDTGLQVTVWWGPIFGRATVYIDGTVFVSAGTLVKLPFGAWVWSR